jgi:hypothetical protein
MFTCRPSRARSRWQVALSKLKLQSKCQQGGTSTGCCGQEEGSLRPEVRGFPPHLPPRPRDALAEELPVRAPLAAAGRAPGAVAGPGEAPRACFGGGGGPGGALAACRMVRRGPCACVCAGRARPDAAWGARVRRAPRKRLPRRVRRSCWAQGSQPLPAAELPAAAGCAAVENAAPAAAAVPPSAGAAPLPVPLCTPVPPPTCKRAPAPRATRFQRLACSVPCRVAGSMGGVAGRRTDLGSACCVRQGAVPFDAMNWMGFRKLSD